MVFCFPGLLRVWPRIDNGVNDTNVASRSVVVGDPQPSWAAARRGISGDFAPVGHHGQRRGDDEDAGAPGEGDPDFASDRPLLE